MKKITFLGPFGATFSHDAYNALAGIYGAPKAIESGPLANYVEASSNEEVLKLVSEHKGYGALAIETSADGRVDKPLESFIDLLKAHKDADTCPFHVIAASKLRIHFCFMAQRDALSGPLEGILSHKKSLGACRNKIVSSVSSKLPTKNVESNGEAARLVAESDEYAAWAAIGPKSAAEKYGLKILVEAFEDRKAFTTFFLLGPREHPVATGKRNRALIVFKLLDESGSLYGFLGPFAVEGLNIKPIHSVDDNDVTCSFAIGVEISRSQLPAFDRAVEESRRHVEQCIVFGPFEILEG